MFFGLKMSSVFVLGMFLLLLLLLLLLLSFCLKKNSRISVFLFNGLFFLITSFSLSILMNSSGFVEEGLLNANADIFSVFILCLDKPSHFLFINSISAGGACGNGLLAVKTVWDRGFGVRNVILISFDLGENVLSSKLFISVISFIYCLLVLVLGFWRFWFLFFLFKFG
jgi:hypothetical protein